MTYLWLKAFHVAAVLAFVGGMLAESVFLVAMTPAEMHPAQRRAAVGVARRWGRQVTTPAMLLVWALGIALALRGGWFSSPWLQVKLVVVVALSGLHGVQSGVLRRLAGDAGRASLNARSFTGPAIIAMAAAIAILVVLKPF